jgi:hypothetical protein
MPHEAPHEALQRAIEGYYPEQYDEWRSHQSEAITKLAARGDEVRLVEVTAAEFVDYCKRTGVRCDITAFTGFLWDKGKRSKAKNT